MSDTPPKVLSEPEIARRLEGVGKHLEFVNVTLEAGWNARDDRERGFHFMACSERLKDIMREHNVLVEQLYKQNKHLKKG